MDEEEGQLPTHVVINANDLNGGRVIGIKALVRAQISDVGTG
jgi:hypothetical protein